MGTPSASMMQASGFRLAGCDMATRSFQVLLLIHPPGKFLLKSLMAKRPTFKHAPRAHNAPQATIFRKHREAVVMR